MINACDKIRSRNFFWVLLLFVLFGLYLSTTSCRVRVKPFSNKVSLRALESRWGIKIQGIRWSAAGYMLDFRYRVIDPDKAAPLFVRKTKPFLIHQKTGAKLVVPSTAKVGPLRTSNKPQKGRIYFILFANPGRLVKPGDKVTIVIGKFRVEDLVIQ